ELRSRPHFRAPWWASRYFRRHRHALELHTPGSVLELTDVEASDLAEPGNEVRQRRLLRRRDVPTALQATARRTGEHDRNLALVVLVAVAHARPVHDERMVEQRSIAVRSGTQLFHEIAEQRKVVRVDLGVLANGLWHVAMMRDDVMRFGHTDLRVTDAARLHALHERGHARNVRAPRERNQVVHHTHVLVVG